MVSTIYSKGSHGAGAGFVMWGVARAQAEAARRGAGILANLEMLFAVILDFISTNYHHQLGQTKQLGKFRV